MACAIGDHAPQMATTAAAASEREGRSIVMEGISGR
jgi:hypothetical protein